MKKILLLLCILSFAAHATTLDEDYMQMEPLMDMLAIQSGASVNLLEPYAEKGNSVAQYLLGAIYEEGRVVTQDLPKAFELYSMAADKNPLAALKKADMLLLGSGTKYDPDAALHLYQSLENDPQAGPKAKQKLALIQRINEQVQHFEKVEELALMGNMDAQLLLVQYTYENENFIGAYVWLSIILDEISEEDEKQEITQFLNTVQGQMPLSEIMHAEKELAELKKTIIKYQSK